MISMVFLLLGIPFGVLASSLLTEKLEERRWKEIYREFSPDDTGGFVNLLGRMP